MTDILSLLDGHRVIPVVVVDAVSCADPLADALVAGGMPIAEVTYRTAAADDALRTIAARGDVLVGAGSVRTADQVDLAVAGGARFIVSPGLSEAVVLRCQSLDIPIVPGIATATELMRALDLGVEIVKLFPAGVIGGPSAVRDLSAPFPSVRFVPTGGVDRVNLVDYLSLPSVIAVGGSWMVARDLIANARFDEIRQLAAEAASLASEVAA
jgi:2-dehydro-3-deoxyphosphogluconate aldolase/(4S)-4-hydroxy-2-oxoglutarate aldolase